MVDKFAIVQPSFFYDDESGSGEGVVVMIMYCYLDTKNPMFTYSINPTVNTKIEIYD